jgi:hypothetical protein
VDGPHLYLSRESARVVGAPGATLLLIDQHGVRARQTVASDDWTFEARGDWTGYVRAELRDTNNDMLALSNPLFDLNPGPSR